MGFAGDQGAGESIVAYIGIQKLDRVHENHMLWGYGRDPRLDLTPGIHTLLIDFLYFSTRTPMHSS